MGCTYFSCIHSTVIPEHDEISAIPFVFVDDFGAGTGGAGLVRRSFVFPLEPARRLRPRAVVLLRLAFLSGSRIGGVRSGRVVWQCRLDFHVSTGAIDGRRGAILPRWFRLLLVGHLRDVASGRCRVVSGMQMVRRHQGSKPLKVARLPIEPLESPRGLEA